MFKRRTDVDSMQFLDQKVFKMYEEEACQSQFSNFPGSKTCKNSETGKIEVNLLTA